MYNGFVAATPEKWLDSAVLSVSDLNRNARRLLEESFPLLWVRGEISNFRAYDSGHWYFSLKDDAAQVRCVMFRHRNQYLDWKPADGARVEARALVTLYEQRGDFQLTVEALRRSGLGALYEAFERLKAKLEQEGLFDAARKRPLPAFPRAIGIVTSPQAAALRDVLTTLARRMPVIPVLIYPAPVQGEGAAEKLAAALRAAGERKEVDLIILCRGGGSIEDLWAYNEEVLARAIAASPIPVLSGVGHETDFTIADFVADQRAPTPTAAAELASPNRAELLHRVEALRGRLGRGVSRSLEVRMQRLDLLSRRLVHPGERIANQRRHLGQLALRLGGAGQRQMAEADWRLKGVARHFLALRPDLALRQDRVRDLGGRLAGAVQRRLEQAQERVARLRAHLEHLSPQAVLGRGYSIVRGPDGTVVRDSADLALDDSLGIRFARGRADARVTAKD
ncbi:MAG TPA: exodeoxyribonuclease VII large subunit [Burkholderiales bacterium]